jgi:hypothetical protein
MQNRYMKLPKNGSWENLTYDQRQGRPTRNYYPCFVAKDDMLPIFLLSHIYSEVIGLSLISTPVLIFIER